MKHSNLSRTLIGGFVGTLVMTVLLYSASSAGAPNTDIAALLGSLLGHGTPATMTGLWWAGMMWHFVNGTIVFSAIYSYFVNGWLAGSSWFRGMIWGLVLWIGMELTLMPATGNGLFSDHATSLFVRIVGSFILFAIYGLILGAITGAHTGHTHQIAHPA